MATDPRPELEFDDESDEQDLAEQIAPGSVAAVVSGTDWTTETIVSQLVRGNIQLNPRFQRRDAWKRDRKSRFIESLIVGLPIPQIVLAESKQERGKFIVLDGKQRLLSILQFWGIGEGDNNAYTLSGLTLREDLKKLSFVDLRDNRTHETDYNALCNQPIRTIVIRNWKDTSFLHTVFLRLNTGSVILSPQELRQALLPGKFSDYIDDTAGQSNSLRRLLGIEGQGKDSPKRLIDAAVKLFEKYYKRIRDNNGIKEKNVLALFAPLGVPASALGTTLLPNLDNLGELRGTHAHQSAKAVQNVLDPQTEYTKVTALVDELVALDEWLTNYKRRIR